MSDRPIISQFPCIVNGDMSGNINGIASVIQKISICSYSFSWSGTSPVGTIKLQVSNNYKKNPDGSDAVAVSWNDLPLEYNGAEVTSVPLTGNSGVGFIDVDLNGAYAIRPVFTFTSGTGTLQAIINAKAA